MRSILMPNSGEVNFAIGTGALTVWLELGHRDSRWGNMFTQVTLAV